MTLPVSARRTKLKQSLYFSEEMLREIQQEADRIGRPVSWVVQRAWALARQEIRAMPGLDRLNERARFSDRESREGHLAGGAPWRSAAGRGAEPLTEQAIPRAHSVATTKARPASPRQGPGELVSNCAR
jgi:uncharacterized small protein (TIGR04563 family)